MTRRPIVATPRHAALLLLIAISFPGCGRGRPWPPEPVEIRLGEDACAGCRMIVSDARFAAELVTREGAIEIYDDLGCLLARHEPGTIDPSGVFVRSVDGKGFVRGDRGFVVAGARTDSPMGFGYAVFAARRDAEDARTKDGRVIALASLLREGRPKDASRSAPPFPRTSSED